MSVVVAEPLASWTTDISNSVRLAWKVAEILTANVATVCAADMYKGKGHTCKWAPCIAEPKIVFSLASVIVLAAANQSTSRRSVQTDCGCCALGVCVKVKDPTTGHVIISRGRISISIGTQQR